MITALLLQTLVEIVNAIFSSFGDVVTELPFGVDAPLVTAFGYVHAFIQALPLFQTPFILILAYYSFKITLLGLKLLLGSRAPQNT